MEEEYFTHDYDGQTVLNPLGLLAILVLGAAMLLLPRRYAVWPMLIMGCFVAPAQRIAVFTLNFDLLRIMVLFGTVRILAYNEWKGFIWKSLDTVLILWSLVGLAAFAILFGSLDAMKTKLGFTYDAVGMYFLFRVLVRNWDDFDHLARGAALISVPVALAFLVEHSTGHNPFAFFGGVPAITQVRDGRLRCQGAFAHSILAGCFWASLMPLMAVMWWKGASNRRWAVVGSVCAALIVVMCASSTPVMAIIFGILAAGLFPLRRWMRWLRWSLVAVLFVMQFLLNNPIWHLIARVDVLSGSTGWHRYHLIDEAINHANEWWVIGSNLGSEHWGEGLHDVTNEYIVQCLHGGVVLLLLFVTMIGLAFRDVGRIIRNADGDPTAIRSAWALGVALFIHVMNFMGVSYFGQINMIWYLTLAVICSLSPSGAVKAISPIQPIKALTFDSETSLAYVSR